MSGEGSLKLQPEYHKLSPIDPFYNRYYKSRDFLYFFSFFNINFP